jgi:hypothetical protein
MNWIALGLLVGCTLLAALYGLAASGHFPLEHRPERLRGGMGAVVLWGSMVAAGVSMAAALVLGWRLLPWYAIVIGVGGALLFAPLVLLPMPDSFVNGRRGLIVLAACTVMLAALMWSAR